MGISGRTAWRKERQPHFSARSADTNHQNGWDSVPGAEPGIRWWRSRWQRRQGSVHGTHEWGGQPAQRAAAGIQAKPSLLSEIDIEEQDRISTGFKELDRVLGDGIVAGSLVLVGGDPGIGKSTILLQVCRNLAGAGRKVLYISGEESLKQIKMRANRIGTVEGDLKFLCETSLERIEHAIDTEAPHIAVIDSIQTMYREEIGSAPGSVSQVRESTGILMQIAKSRGIAIFVVGHVTKEGVVAGPRVLEHMVDTVLYFEGDRNASYRILRSVKNRFGSTNEIGVFEMQEQGWWRWRILPSTCWTAGRNRPPAQ